MLFIYIEYLLLDLSEFRKYLSVFMKSIVSNYRDSDHFNKIGIEKHLDYWNQ
jgi:hypothetical protein